MEALKEKVTEKLSRLFADSPSSPTSSSSSPSFADQAQQNQAGSSYNGVKSFTSLLSFVLPSASSDVFGSNKDLYDVKPVSPLPVVRSDEGALSRYEFDSNEFYTPQCKNNEKLTFQEDRDGSLASRGRTNSESSEVFEEAPEGQYEPISVEKLQYQEKPMANLTDESTFISPELYEFLHSSIPNIVKGCQWILLYSTLRHGISLRTLIRKSADLPGPCLLIVGDKKGAVFGGLLQGPLIPTAKRKYQGTNQSFVFTTIYGAPRLFRPTGANRYFYMCLNDLLAFGGGGGFALSLDGDLLSGTSGACDTFGNLCLAHNPEFELKNVELWGFTHSSQYLI